MATITELTQPHAGRRQFRIEDDRGYCQFTIWNGSDELSSFGGSLWPDSFPEMFELLPNSVSLGCGRVRVIGQLPAAQVQPC